MKRHRATALVAALAFLLAGCGGGTAANFGKRAAQFAERAAGGTWIPPAERNAAARIATEAETIEGKATGVLLRYIDNLDEEEAAKVMKVACEANDYLNVGPKPTDSEVRNYVGGHIPGTAGYRYQAMGLAEDIRKAKSNAENRAEGGDGLRFVC